MYMKIKSMDSENIEYRLLTSTVVKDMYLHRFPFDSITNNFIKNRIVSWEYSEKWWGYLICYIDVYGLPVWIYNF